MMESIIVGITGAIIIAVLGWLVKETRTLIKLIKRHEKVLFGDEDISDWDGLVNICLANKKYSINDRRAFIALISILHRNKIIDFDSELQESIDILKRE